MPDERIKDLRELERYRERFKGNEWVDSLGLFKPTGSRIRGEGKNLFIYHFDGDDVEDFVNIYKEIDGSNINEAFATFFRASLKDKCEEMNRKRICPVECMLYASKTVNKYLENRYIRETVAEVAAENITVWGEEGREVLSHIISRWHWFPQLKIAVDIARITRDRELLRKAHRIFADDERVKVDLFRALVESGDRELLPYVFNMIRNLQRNSDMDRRMLNLLEKNFYLYMPEALNEFENFLGSPGVRYYVSNRINRLLAEYRRGGLEGGGHLQDPKRHIIELASKANPESGFSFAEREAAFEELIGYLRNKALRRQALFAFRKTGRPEAANYIIQVLRNGNCRDGEIKDALVTLGFLGYQDDDYFLSRNFSFFDISLWTYYYLTGREEYLERLIEHFLTGSRERAAEIISHLNQFYLGRRTEIQKAINEKLVAVLRERRAEDIVRAADNMSVALDKLNINDMEEALAEIFRVFGFGEESAYGLDDEQAFLSLLEMTGRYYVKNAKTKTGQKLERFLFHVADNYEGKVKNRALKILKSVEEGEVGR